VLKNKTAGSCERRIIMGHAFGDKLILTVKPVGTVVYCYKIKDVIGAANFLTHRADCRRLCPMHQRCAAAITMNNADILKKREEARDGILQPI
jgi:hypothetical protein